MNVITYIYQETNLQWNLQNAISDGLRNCLQDKPIHVFFIRSYMYMYIYWRMFYTSVLGSNLITSAVHIQHKFCHSTTFLKGHACDFSFLVGRFLSQISAFLSCEIRHFENPIQSWIFYIAYEQYLYRITLLSLIRILGRLRMFSAYHEVDPWLL